MSDHQQPEEATTTAMTQVAAADQQQPPEQQVQPPHDDHNQPHVETQQEAAPAGEGAGEGDAAAKPARRIPAPAGADKKPKHLSPAAAKRAATPKKMPFRPTGPIVEPTPFADSMASNELHAANTARHMASGFRERSDAPLNFEKLDRKNRPQFEYQEGYNSVSRYEHQQEGEEGEHAINPDERQQVDAEEIQQQYLRIQRMQQLVDSMSETNSIERQRAQALRNVKLGGAIDRTHSIDGEGVGTSESGGNGGGGGGGRDSLDEKMKQIVAASPVIVGGGTASPSSASPTSSQRRARRVIMSPTMDDESAATTERSPTDVANETTSNSVDGQPKSPTRALLSTNSAASTAMPSPSSPDQNQQQQLQQQHYYDPYPSQPPSQQRFAYSQPQQPPQQEFDGFINIGDDPQDPLHESPARGAVELLRRDAMSDGGIMLPYNKMRLRSLARRSSPVLSRIPPFRQQEAAAAAEQVREHAKQQKEAADNIRKSAIIDVATAALKRKETQLFAAAKDKKQELREKKHKSATEELAERAFRRKFGIPFEEAVPTQTVREQQLSKNQQQAGGYGDDDVSLSSSTGGGGVRPSTPRSGARGGASTPLRTPASAGRGSTPRRTSGAATARQQQPPPPQQQQRSTAPVASARAGSSGSMGSNLFFTTTAGAELPEAEVATATLRVSHAASLVHLCAQVIRGFVAPSLTAAEAQGAMPDQRRLAEQAVLQSVESSAVAVDALLRDPTFSLEQLRSTETALERALRDHNSLNSSRETSVTTKSDSNA